jgi:hypothetical protein
MEGFEDRAYKKTDFGRPEEQTRNDGRRKWSRYHELTR